MSPRVSVVVPIYNVEPYLPECLDSISGQTMRDFEVVMVDDGSADRSAEIAAAYESRDPRFRLVRQPNGGLGHARNTGIKLSTGEFLMFVDSDDALPPDALEHLLTSLDATGSDFATGNVWRLRPTGLEPSQWLAPVFATTRKRTHVTQFRPLVTDRIACNKLWRRSFWDENDFRFPEGVLFEDQYVTLPAHFLARAVDVVKEPVYYWRARPSEDRSITQRRTDQRAIVDRMIATQHVRDFLRTGPVPEALAWYDASLVADDLLKFLNALLRADADYRREFLVRVNELLDDASPDIFDGLPANERRKWELVRAGEMDRLIRLLRRERRERRTPPVTRRQRIVRLVPEPLRQLVPARVRRRLLASRR